ncbi:MAG TPA: hypothetical protein VLG15_07450 [Thermoanaerobaculia bacterium]|nr:hypothetical protein [Thermoanaerobaculia bacterium]
MFVGHYGASYAIRAARPAIPLWLLFIAVQLIDVVWALLVLVGIEKARIVPGITASNPFDLYYMPYTHSLVAAIVWAMAATAACRSRPRFRTGTAAIWVGVAVFSHWVFDFVVHRPDLPLYDDTMKMGLGLWNFPVIAFALEAALLFGGMALYLRKTTSVDAVGRFGPATFGIIMLAIQAWIFFGPPPASPAAAAVTALVSYVAFAALVRWLDGRREPVGARP